VRPRYLGIEVAGQPVPRLSPAAWHDLLQHRWRAHAEPTQQFRIIRVAPTRALVEVDQRTLALGRTAWNAVIVADGERSYRVATVRAWGTLVSGKAWLRAAADR